MSHQAWLLVLSLLLNLALGITLARPGSRHGKVPEHSTLPTPTSSAAPSEYSIANPADINAITDSPPPFHWNEIESTDYRQYIRNLRAVGCPEIVIHDLIVAEINQCSAARRRAIWDSPATVYWQKPSNQKQPTPSQVKRLMDLESERSGLVKELLGKTTGPQALIDIVFLQPGTESWLSYLPEEKRQGALQAIADADLDRKEALLRANHEGDSEQALFREKLKALQGILSPQELAQFRMRHSPRAQWLRTEVQYLDCTPAEFQALLERREARLGSSPDLAPDRSVARQDLEEILGEQRAKAFDRVGEMNYLNCRSAIECADVSPDLADRAAQFTADALKQAAAFANDKSVPVEERNREVTSLQLQTEARLQDEFGEPVARLARRALQRGINTALANIRP